MEAESKHPLEIHAANDLRAHDSEDSTQFELKEDPTNVLNDPTQLGQLRGRADAKIRYAKLVLQELKFRERGPGVAGGDDFDRSHEESFLFHLFGALDAFTQELNIYYGCGLRRTAKEHVTRGNIQKALEKQKRKSNELIEIYDLEQDKTSWLFHAGKMRHHSTHLWGVGRVFFGGGVHDGQVWFKNPETQEDVKQDVLVAFAEWVDAMESLIERLRVSAIEANKERRSSEKTS